MIKIGLIGLGNQSQENLIPAIVETRGLCLYAISSRDYQKAKTISEQYSIQHILNPDEIFKQCDAIAICATPEVHYNYLLNYSKYRKPIFVEKPPAYNSLELQTLLKTVEDYSTIVSFGLNFKYSAFYKKISLETNDFEDVNYIRIKSYASKPNHTLWNCKTILESSLLASHIHAIDMLCYTTNSKVSKVNYQITWLSPTKYILNIFIYFENKKMGLLEFSNAYNRFKYEFECIGKNGGAESIDFNLIKTYSLKPNTGTMITKSYTNYEEPFLHGGYERTGYKTQFEVFVKKINSNKNDTREINSLIEVYNIIEEILNGRRTTTS